jgi:ribosome-binding factor A
MTDKPGLRQARVAERVREEVASMLVTEVRDPRLAGVVVVRVQMTPDLREAVLYVRLLSDEAGRRVEAVKALSHAARRFRREVAERVGLRFSPTLEFRYDEGVDTSARVEELLAEIRSERDEQG